MNQTKKRKILHNAHHILIGIVLILKGIDKISHHTIFGILILLFGSIILAYSLRSILTRKHNLRLEVAFHLFEALVSLFTAWIFFDEGKSYLPYVWCVAALLFMLSAFVEVRKMTNGMRE